MKQPLTVGFFIGALPMPTNECAVEIHSAIFSYSGWNLQIFSMEYTDILDGGGSKM